MTTQHGTSLRRPVPSAAVPLAAIRGLGDRLAAVVRSGAWMELALLAVVFVAVAGIRTNLAPWQSGDYTGFLQPWSAYLELHGFHGLGDRFADYNMPYLYLLYIGTLLPFDPLTWVKIVAFVSDLALAAGCAAILTRFRLPRHLVVLGSVSVLLLPEVLLNSAAWGQADSTYSAFVVWALWAALRNRATTAWVLFALAFTFKLQAAFLLPVLVMAHLGTRWRITAPGVGLLAALATEIPALIAGRSPASLAEVYLDQTNGYQALTLNAPSIYAFLPDWAYDIGRPAGMCFAIAVVGIVSYVVLRRTRLAPLEPRTLLLLAVTLGLIAPYVLPQMHERYFYLGNVLLFLLALVQRRLLPVAFLAQGIAVMSYSGYLLGGTSPLSLPMLALLEGVVVLLVAFRLLRDCGVTLTNEQLLRAVQPARPRA